jgi:glycosyltransferase involved in cell wall biosynthesis
MTRQYLIWYWSPTGGGGAQYAVNLARRLALAFGNDAVKLSLHAADPSLARARALGIDTLSADVTTSRIRPLATIAALKRSADILAAHARGTDCVIVPMNFASAAPLSLGLKQYLVYVAHDPAPHPGDYAPMLQRATQGVLINRAKWVVAPSHYTAEQLARASSAKAKVRVAPLSSMFPPDETPLPLQDDPVRLLCAGRMIHYKGLDILADALPLLSDRANWRLTIAGEGPALTDALRDRLASSRVEIKRAWMSEDALEAHIRAADVIIAPYRSATQSGIIAQALAAGRPCVVTPVGALAEQIGDGVAGWVAAAPESSALAAALNEAIADRAARAAKADAARRLAQAAWTANPWDFLASAP